ncbi:MAG TPA: GntR family transcriptional regulator [Bordetella sp.]
MSQTIVRVADLRQQVYDALKARITTGKFPSDAHLFEISLAKELNVSRTPVREALAMLVRDGLLVQLARGFRFPRFSEQEIIEIIEIRLLLEPYAIERMILDNTRAAMAALGAGMRRDLLAAGGGDARAYAEVHRKVRDDIYAHVGNRQLADAIAKYEDSIHYIRVSTLNEEESRQVSYDGMLRLADAIARGEAGTARKLMEQQLINARLAFLDHVTAAAELEAQ